MRCLRVAVQGNDPEEEKFIDLLDQPVVPAPVEQFDRRLPRPVGVVGNREVRQCGFDRPASDFRVAAESEEGEAKAFPDLEQRVGLVPDFFGPACAAVLLPDFADQVSKPSIASGKVYGRGELAHGEFELSFTDGIPTIFDPLIDLRLETNRGELGDDQRVAGKDQHDDKKRGEGQSATIPAKPANAAAGDWLAGEVQRSVISHGLEVGRELRRRGIAIPRIRCQALADDRLESGRDVRVGRVHPGGIGAAKFSRSEQSFGHRHRLRRQRERPRSPHQAVEEDDTQGIEIRTEGDVVRRAGGERLELLGRHVSERATNGRGGGLGAVDRLLREVEVQQHRQAVATHEDV